METLRNLTISTRIAIGFAVMLVLVLGVGGYATYTAKTTLENFSEYRSMARQTNYFGRVQANVLSTRLASKDFVLKGTEDSIEAVRSRAATVTDLTDKAISKADTQAEINMLRGLSEQFAIYQSTFEEVTDLQAKRNELVHGTLNKVGPEMRKTVTGIKDEANRLGLTNALYQAGYANQHLLLGRLYVQRFLIQNDLPSIDRANVEFTKASEALANLVADQQTITVREEITKAQEGLATYAQTFNEVASVITDRNNLIQNTLDKIGPTVAADIEQAKLENKAIQDNVGPDIQRSLEATASISLIVAGLSVVIGLLAAFIIAKAIVTPMRRMTGSMTQLADGDLEVAVPCLGQTNELGDMGKAVEIFRENAIEVKRMTAAQEEADRQKEEEKRVMMESMANNFESSVGEVIAQVAQASSHMQDTAGRMTTTAENTNERSTAVSTAVEEASANVQTVASATEELSGSIGEITRQVDKSTTIAQKAITEVTRMGDEMGELRNTVESIGSVISLITDIADKTNLLSLNATIEAARAGDAGKGFAVVAGEVKNLATQTARATDDISSQIESVQGATSRAVEMMAGIAETIDAINNISIAIAGAVEEQSAATSEIARNIQEAARGTDQVRVNIEDVAVGATDTGQASRQVLEAAGDLASQSTTLQDQMGKFLEQLRAA